MKPFHIPGAYRLVKQSELKEIGLTGTELVHEKSGARVICLPSDDETTGTPSGGETTGEPSGDDETISGPDVGDSGTTAADTTDDPFAEFRDSDGQIVLPPDPFD